jgi:short subunit dehydrogenase-like uncharacterized protein
MSQAGEVVVYGASGYTGNLIAKSRHARFTMHSAYVVTGELIAYGCERLL